MSRSRIWNVTNRARRQHALNRLLKFESLETRRLLFFAEFNFNLYEDAGGTPGAAIENSVVVQGDTFFLEVVAEDTLQNPLGLHGISLDIKWNRNAFVLADEFDASEIVTDKLPFMQLGNYEPEVGRINDLTGSLGIGLETRTLLGLDGPERFALIRLEAVDTVEEAEFSMRGGMDGIAFFPPIWDKPSDFYFERESISVIPQQPDEPSDQPVEAPPFSDVPTALNSSPADVVAETEATPLLATTEVHTPVRDVPATTNSEPPKTPLAPVEPAAPDVANDATPATSVDFPIDMGAFGTLNISRATSPDVEAIETTLPTEQLAEHESQSSRVANFDNACFATKRPITAAAPAAMPQSLVADANIRVLYPPTFIGPVPIEYRAVWLAFDNSDGDDLAKHHDSRRIDEQLVDLLATKLHSLGRPTL